MSNRQKIYIGLAVSAGVCTGVAVFLYLRHRRQIALSKSPNDSSNSITAGSILSSLKSRRGREYTEITSSSSHVDNDDTESVRFQSSDGATVEVGIPGGSAPLTPELAVILTRFLEENNENIELLHRILTNIANAATFTESQVTLANAGCIDRLRDILSTTDNETTQCKVLLALNNLALNEYTITRFSGIIPIVINLCRTAPSGSLVRLHGLNLLVNMSVLENLHKDFMENLYDLGSIVELTFDNNEETLSAGKILVNLSTNKSNLEYLLKLTGIELKTIVSVCTPSKRSIDNDQASKLEDILLRYLSFYCNLADMIVNDLQSKNTSNSWLNDPIPYRTGAIYFELFDHDKQLTIKGALRPQYSSNTINTQIKRLRQALDIIRQIQFESNVTSIQDEFNDHDRISSTPKKILTTNPLINETNPLDNLENLVNEQFDDDVDETILPDARSPSEQSYASFRSAYSTNENNTFTSLDNSTTA